MKALITAFALLSFVAASTIPLATEAQAKTTHHAKTKKHVNKVSHKHKTGKRMKKPSQGGNAALTPTGSAASMGILRSCRHATTLAMSAIGTV